MPPAPILVLLRRHGARLPRAAALITCLLAAPTLAPAAEESPPTPLERAWSQVEALEDLLDDPDAPLESTARELELLVAGTEELTAADQEVADADDAPTERERRTRTRSIERLQGEVIDLLLEGLTETSLDASGRNVEEPLNVASARLLGRVHRFVDDTDDRDRVSRRIVRKLKWMDRARHDVGAEVHEGAFVALARLGSERALAWMIDEQIHARKQPEEVARLRAALRSLRQVEPMSSRFRFALFEELLRRYVAVESLAQVSSADIYADAAGEFWGQIGGEAIALAQQAAGYPGGEDDVAFATMKALSDWFRDHDNPRAAPWSRD